MPSTIVITRDNLDNDDNNSFTYNYPSGMPFDNHEVAVESVSIPYAWANISSRRVVEIKIPQELTL